MTAPLPTPYLSPMAGMVNALRRLYIRRARPVVAAQLVALDEAKNLNHQLTTAAFFADTDAAGYIDRSFLEAP